jgi:hypothetical protein
MSGEDNGRFGGGICAVGEAAAGESAISIEGSAMVSCQPTDPGLAFRSRGVLPC